MTKAIAIVLTLVGSLAVSSALDRAQENGDDAIRAALQTYAAAWNSGDARTIAGMYTLHSDHTGFGGVITRGRENIEARYQSLFARALSGTQLSIEMSSLRFLKPDVAVVDGTVELSGMRAAGGGLETSRGLFLAIMINEADNWRFTAFWSKAASDDPSADAQ